MKNKLIALSSLALLSVLTLGRSFINANAVIVTKPSNYLWGSYYSSTQWYNYKINNTGSSYTTGSALFTRFGASSPYGYSNSVQVVGDLSNGLTLDTAFYLSTTAWTQVGANYLPTSSSIGSSNTTNAVKARWDLNNGSTSSYWFDLDLSSNSAEINLNVYYVSINNPRQVFTTSSRTTTFQRIYIPMTTITIIELQSTSSTRLVDGYFLSEGQNFLGSVQGDAIYQSGFLAGINSAQSANINFMNIFSGTMDAVAGIFNISILGDITLGSLALFPLLGVVVMFFKKVIQ
jgi:hypothetical protein